MGPIEAIRIYRKINRAQDALGKVVWKDMTGWKSKAGFVLVLLCAALRAAEANGYCQGCAAVADTLGILGGAFLGVGIAHKLDKLKNGVEKAGNGI